MKRPSREVERWADCVRIKSRYLRSVHIERDFAGQDWLDNYIVTPLVRGLLGRIAEGLQPGGKARAWSLTGPYGAGKSAFALFLAHLLDAGGGKDVVKGRQLLKAADPEISARLFGRNAAFGLSDGLVPVRITAERGPLDRLLVSGLRRALEGYWSSGRRPKVVDSVVAVAVRLARGKAVPVGEIVQLFVDSAVAVQQSAQQGKGLLVVLDEAGKALEFAAFTPERGDIFVLQELAEAAARSGDAPLLLVTLLHQAFDSYAGRVGAVQRGEWAKVQGRFEDVVYQEATDQVLRLIGASLERDADAEALLGDDRSLVTRTVEDLRLPSTSERSEVEANLMRCLPLHPVAAVCLPTLCRSHLSQNERSLFAFLGSAEPWGFWQWLQETSPTSERGSVYTLDRLFDYVRNSLGTQLYGQHAKQWLLIDDALARLPADCGELDVKLVKCIGMLGVLGESTGLRASLRLLTHAVTDCSKKVTEEDVSAALDKLRDASILVYRKYRDAFQLWGGSDTDIEALVREALSNIDPSDHVLRRLRRLGRLRPIVARRHLLKTGAFRYFEVRFVDQTVFNTEPLDHATDADGIVWIVVPTSDDARRDVGSRLEENFTWGWLKSAPQPVIVGLPANLGRLRGIALELSALEAVAEKVDLQSDRVAQREIAGRIADAERKLHAAVSDIFAAQGGCEWFYDRTLRKFSSYRAFTSFASDIFDEVFKHAPYVHSEILNRRQLSSSAAAARRALVQAMVDQGHKARLGFEGTPPEVSIYRSLLERHKMHRQEGETWRFHAPVRSRDQGALRPAYDELVRLMTHDDARRVKLDAYYDLLRRPPYGLKDGVIPVVVLVALLEHESELALYEEGQFVSRLTAATVERLLRNSGDYEVQAVRIGAARTQILVRLREALELTGAASGQPMLDVVRGLARFARRLPDYTKNTRSASETAQRVRDVLMRAEEPGPLLFCDLPRACDLEPFSEDKKPDRARVDLFIERLKRAVHELAGAYPKLMDDIRSSIADEFGVSPKRAQFRKELTQRAHALEAASVDLSLAGFVTQAADATTADEQWLVGIATQVGGKPPERWLDADAKAMRLKLAVLRERFCAIESILHAQHARDGSIKGLSLVRVAIARSGAAFAERVLALKESDRSLVDAYRGRLRQLIGLEGDVLSREALLTGLVLETEALLTANSNTQEVNGETAA